MKLLRKCIFWCHLGAGTVVGLVVLTMSLTGVLLAYQRQLTAWADLHGLAAIAPEGTRMSPEALLVQFRNANPDLTATALTLQSDRTAPAAVAINGGRTFFLNPYSGATLGQGSKKTRDFFRVVTDWHRWLGAMGENRNAARAVTGASNLLFLFIVVSGFYLWWPRKWTLNSSASQRDPVQARS
jgi:uncharacterized iron-regulated membrane protein